MNRARGAEELLLELLRDGKLCITVGDDSTGCCSDLVVLSIYTNGDQLCIDVQEQPEVSDDGKAE